MPCPYTCTFAHYIENCAPTPTHITGTQHPTHLHTSPTHCRVKAVQRPEKDPHRSTAQQSLPSHDAPPPSSSQTLPRQRHEASHGTTPSSSLYKAPQEKVMPGILSKSLPTPSAPPPSATGSSTQPSQHRDVVPRPVRKARSETDLRESDMEKTIKVSCTHVRNTDSNGL